MKEKKIQFDITIGENLPQVIIDADRIRQVLTNIISNAIHFTPERGRIQAVIDRDSEKFIRISIQDSGIGIPRGQLRKIFTRFYRVDKSRSRDSGGSGIGLTIAKQLVEAHGGKIWAESLGENKGATISFTLPIA